MKRLVVLTSGGDSPGMNAAIRAVVKLAAARGTHVLGALDGYDGLIDGKFRELTRALDNGTIGGDLELDFAGGMGGTRIGTARSSRFREPSGRKAAVGQLDKHHIDGVVVIGGNGSLTGAHLLSKE